MKFLVALFLLCMIGFIVLLFRMVGVFDPETIGVKFLDLITISVPPALTAAL